MRHLVQITTALALSGAPLAAATYKNTAFQAVTQSVPVALKSRNGGARPASQVFVTVTRLDGGPVSQGDMPRAGGFANQVACAGGTALGTVAAGVRGPAAQFEVLCVGN